MPPSSSEQPMIRSAHWLRDQLAGGGRAGEAHVVDALDQRGADVAARTGHDLPDLTREAGLLEELGTEERGQHGLGVRLDHHRVAGQQRRQAVAQRQGEGVVPGRDDADDALGQPVHLDVGEAGEHARHAPAVEMVVGGACVVAGGERDVRELQEGVLAGLARLDADQVADLLLPIEHQVVEPHQRGGALGKRRAGPGLLRPPGPRDGLPDVGLARLRDVGHRLPVERGLHRCGLAGAGQDPSGEVLRVVGLQGVGRPRVVLGVGRTVEKRPSCGILGAHETESM